MNTYEVSDVGRKSRRKRKRRSRVKVTGGEEAGRIGERVGQPPSMGGPPAASERKRPQTGHVDVNDLRLKGRGPSKKRAKMRAAELTLSSLVQFPHEGSEGIGSAANDFTEDQLDGWQMFDTDDTERKVFPQPGSQSSPKEVVSTRLLGGLGPMGLLGQLRPGLRYFCLTERLPGRPERRFIAAVRVDGRIFEGCGHSQRAAKARAAAAALRSLCDVSLESKVNGLCGDRQQLPQFFAEAIFQLARQKYQQLMDQSPATPNMAAIVMTTGLELSTAEVVSMATGTKCLDWDGGHCDDNALHDCHAEVVCRRALLRFLYAQLETLLIRPVDQTDVGPASIFEPVTGRQRVFRLRDHIGLHMFVTSSPCGDARLNCPYENDTSPSMKPNMLRCGLRTKVVGGQGTLPITARSANPMGASLSPGKPQVSMSCTDKIAKSEKGRAACMWKFVTRQRKLEWRRRRHRGAQHHVGVAQPLRDAIQTQQLSFFRPLAASAQTTQQVDVRGQDEDVRRLEGGGRSVPEGRAAVRRRRAGRRTRNVEQETYAEGSGRRGVSIAYGALKTSAI
ncbi:double-stranded RNA-specific editase B2-like isoform X2 [Syngnathus scovelli]|uniref:double-stranded RNA-specific editase B2-like isoform X2 n=1 Tax=Syngnathus scovelli TaxID=161590 RepID=UPI002110591F|nr:double-stranded RNA-specific editase B2-like isoform X2 [Syngnathus scovelli]